MLAAEWSHEAAVEYEQDIRLAAVIRQLDGPPGEINQAEIGSRSIKTNLGHRFLPPEQSNWLLDSVLMILEANHW